MKTKKCYPVIALFFLLAFVSCNSAPSAGTKTEYRLRKMTTRVLLYPEQLSPKMDFSLTLLDAAKPANLRNFFNALLYEGKTLDEYRDILVGSYRAGYRTMRETAKESPDLPHESLNWHYTETMQFLIFTDKAALIGREKDYYTGGAHGMQEKTYYAARLTANERLYWQDFFTDYKSPQLYSLGLDELRAKDNLPPDADLSSGIYFEDRPALPDNFFLTKGGFGFHWNVYEIAPYAEGSIEIIIPWEKIRPFLSEKGISLLADFGINQ
jgi:hypothetical protein